MITTFLHVDQPEVEGAQLPCIANLEAIQRSCLLRCYVLAGKTDALCFSPLLGYPAVETESWR